jgi:hypothetical protein
MRQTLFARLLYFAPVSYKPPLPFDDSKTSRTIKPVGLILAARTRDLQAIRANPYCMARTVVVSIAMKRTGRLSSFNKHKIKREDENEKTRDAVSNAR